MIPSILTIFIKLVEVDNLGDEMPIKNEDSTCGCLIY